MKSKMFKKIMAAALATAMTASMAGCGSSNTSAPAETPAAPAETPAEAPAETPAEETAPAEEVVEEEPAEEVGMATVLTDENGNPYDLGGMEIIIRNWWSGDPAEPTNAYEEATEEYREWIQETYNFTIKEQGISDWGMVPQDFVDYATAGGDENYVFILRDDPAVTSAMANGLMVDLSTIDCLDFSADKFQQNLLHKQYSKNGAIYAMYAGASEPRTGVYFNKRLLTDAGIDPEQLYDWQASGEWTWAKFEEVLAQVQRDVDNDGVIDVYGANANNSSLTNAAVFSNGGEYVGQDASGAYTYRLEDAETQEALEYAMNIFNNYWEVEPEGANWDYYKEAFINGEYAFMIEDAYAGQPGNFLDPMEDEFGFVMFPKGPKMNDYTNCWTNNPAAIPSCYDAEKAWKLAFAWNLYTEPTPGYEDYDGWKASYYAGFRDTRSVDETLAMMREKGMITFDGIIPDMERGSQFTWNINPGADLAAAVEGTRDAWKGYIEAANK